MYWSFSVYYEIKNPFYRQNEIFGKKNLVLSQKRPEIYEK